MAPIPSMSNKIYEEPTISGHHSPIVLFLAKFGVLDFGTGWKRSNLGDVHVDFLPKDITSPSWPYFVIPYDTTLSAASSPWVATASSSASPVVLVNKIKPTPLVDAIIASITPATAGKLSPSLTVPSATAPGTMTRIASLDDFFLERRDGEHHEHHGHHGGHHHHHNPHDQDQSQQQQQQQQQPQQTSEGVDMDKDSPTRRRITIEVGTVVAAIVTLGIIICFCIVRKCRHRKTPQWEVAKDSLMEHAAMQKTRELHDKGIYRDGLEGDRARAAYTDERVAKKEEKNVKEGKKPYGRYFKACMNDKQYKRRVFEAFIREDLDKMKMDRSKDRMLAEKAQENGGRRVDRPANEITSIDTVPSLTLPSPVVPPPTRPPPSVPPPTRSPPAVPSATRVGSPRPRCPRQHYRLREGEVVELIPITRCQRHPKDPTLRPPRPEDRELARRMREQARGRRRNRESEI